MLHPNRTLVHQIDLAMARNSYLRGSTSRSIRPFSSRGGSSRFEAGNRSGEIAVIVFAFQVDKIQKLGVLARVQTKGWYLDLSWPLNC